ncbi:GAF modulated sigma54 specific transcriptional regulator, Fis family [Sulfobacillus acidophilus DSM 10332]|uniref:GAF modulated sigma54 specific transcriptional regulator, Fis family n=1 Tax=Sulfobacillus acidophilus (strain ATCC 700253 / DSM 10332 / NAL) TaxID=679936 RepID=G8TZJ4_SULAD|nr:GAF modulated sigma54 specific transcriptional regulator, Fis family [Sulfobacillus acidophilus DSM 10332]
MRSDLMVRPVHEGIHQAVNETELAWRQFVVAGERRHVPGRPFVLESWIRCAQKGIEPGVSAAQKILSESTVNELWASHMLHENIDPYIQSLTDTMMPSRHLVVFTDAQGFILKISGESSVRQLAENMNFVPGSNWFEDQAGTNAIGTCLALGAPVQIFAAEHYCAPVHPWTCSAAPIRDPATHEILGVIDLTGLREYHHPHSLAVVQSIARAIEDRLRDTLEIERFTIFGDYLELATRYPETLLIALDRGHQVIRCSSAVWEHGWVDSNNQLLHLPPEFSRLADGSSWEVDGSHQRWKWILHHCYRQHQRVGAIIQAVPTGVQGRNRSLPAGKGRGVGKDDNPVATISFNNLVGNSPKFLDAVNQARAVARSDAPVLILGETGTGKELMAQAIHSASRYAAGPFVAVNCGAIPHELIGSELFGFEGGSFTGAAKEGRPGKFELADGGTIFLDEIGELPLALQPYLLRVLDLGEVTRIGGQSPFRLNVRVIAATNQDLETMVENGTFRRDLYYRLNVIAIVLPPIRERPGDAIRLLEHFVTRIAQKTGRPVPPISPALSVALDRYPWRGNVREIRNLAERIMAALPVDGTVTIKALPDAFRQADPEMNLLTPDSGLRQQEIDWIRHVLEECHGNISLAAKRLGIHRSTLYRKLSTADRRQNPSR